MNLISAYHAALSVDRRVSLPRAWRVSLGREILLALASRYDFPVIELVPARDFEGRLQEFESPEAKRKFADGCRRAFIDYRGRLILPRAWCDAAGIAAGGEIKLVGRAAYCECWNAVNFERQDRLSRESFRQLDPTFGLL